MIHDNVKSTLEERKETHGEFTRVADTAQSLKAIFRKSANWNGLTQDQREALDMDASKTARILNGDPDFPDHWLDKAGYNMLIYAKLVSDQ